jgi:ABC-type Fe3+ transport system substrate-binding protein
MVWTRRAFTAGTLAMGAAATIPARAEEADPFNYRGADREAALSARAKREGTLTFYSSLIPNLGLKAIADGFRAKYEFVDLQTWRGTEIAIAQKALAERRAGRQVGDVLEGSELQPLLVKSGALQAFFSPELAKIPARYRDPSGLSAATRFSYYGGCFNTRAIPPGTQPKTYAALLDPKWKGKLAWRVGSDSGALMLVTNLLLTMGEAKADSYLRALAAQNVVAFSGSAQALIDRAISGEYAMSLTTALHLPVIAAAKGAPIAPQPFPPIPTTVASIMIARDTQHPASSMLFVDYMLSTEGQRVLRDAQYFPVDPGVAPLKALQSVSPRLSGMPENFISDTTLAATHEKANTLLRRYFG